MVNEVLKSIPLTTLGKENSKSTDDFSEKSLLIQPDPVGSLCKSTDDFSEKSLLIQPDSVGSLWSIERHRKLALVCMILADFTTFSTLAVLAPFFPYEAERKNVSQSTAGLIFAVFALVMALTSFGFGRLVPHVGLRFLFISGLFVNGVTNILFGTLYLVESRTSFVTLAFILRICSALGVAAYCTALLCYIGVIFPERVSQIMGMQETSLGAGACVGPAVGSFLYNIGGYELPFYVVGGVSLLLLPYGMVVLPKSDIGTSVSRSAYREMCRPGFLLASLVDLIVAAVMGFWDSTLAGHAAKVGVSVNNAGYVFMTFGGAFALLGPLWGSITNRMGRNYLLMGWGLVIAALSILLTGPSPILFFLPHSLETLITGLILAGASLSLAAVPTFDGMLNEICSEGTLSRNVATYGMVSGWWQTMFSLGQMIGPAAGGFFLDSIGFSSGVTIISGITLLTGVGCLVYNCGLRQRGT